jgi:hypothetical protein
MHELKQGESWTPFPRPDLRETLRTEKGDGELQATR